MNGPVANEGWHLKREIQLGHLITTLTISVSAMFYVAKLEQRIALLEQLAVSQDKRDSTQDQHTNRSVELLHSQLEKMDAKLDRIIERYQDRRP